MSRKGCGYGHVGAGDLGARKLRRNHPFLAPTIRNLKIEAFRRFVKKLSAVLRIWNCGNGISGVMFQLRAGGGRDSGVRGDGEAGVHRYRLRIFHRQLIR